jgi:hypothetical protein
MREYVEAPGPDAMPVDELRRWIERGIEYVSGLPFKAKKTKARSKAAKTAKTTRPSARSKKKTVAKRTKRRR